MRNAMFCVLAPGPSFQRLFWESLKAGCVPVVLSLQQPLPFQELIDWRLAAVRLAAARLPELHFVLRSYDTADIVEMKRKGRLFFENYLADVEVVVRSILVFLSQLIGVPLRQHVPFEAIPLFNQSFHAPVLVPVNSIPASDDEYLGPLEGAVDSLGYNHNISFLNMYSGAMWNQGYDISRSPEFLINNAELPAEAEFFPDVNIGYRPIEPGSGNEFSKALGGNRAREQFTVVMITYNRDAVLTASLERLHRLPYLNKVIVIWNNVGREPVGAWPRLHVPVEFIKVSRNSLNNRFIHWDRIKTEAVLSLDDDIDLKQHEIIFAFRVWRENRDRLVGFPARYHARFGSEMFYNSNHTCQYSLILTGASFLHKTFLYEYSQQMPAVIREHVDKVMNCEDIAMNFLVSHLTRKPPIKTTSKWTLRCPTCTETLSQDEGHFRERHECIRLFTKIYGYNPLKFTQFRADSVLFKTRLPADKQKCFRYV